MCLRSICVWSHKCRHKAKVLISQCVWQVIDSQGQMGSYLSHVSIDSYHLRLTSTPWNVKCMFEYQWKWGGFRTNVKPHLFNVLHLQHQQSMFHGPNERTSIYDVTTALSGSVLGRFLCNYTSHQLLLHVTCSPFLTNLHQFMSTSHFLLCSLFSFSKLNLKNAFPAASPL